MDKKVKITRFTPSMPKRKVKQREHYVNNKDFLNALIEYRKIYYDAQKNNERLPIIPNYIGDCILKISTRVSFKPNYVNYPFKDEMISDGYFTCVKYILNFNPDRSDNPFAYFTSVVNNAFKARINKEKRQLIAKERLIESKGFAEVFSDNKNADGSSNSSDYNTIKDNVYLKMKYN